MPAPDQPVDKALAAVLRRLREARGLSQEATAQAACVSLNTYSRIELAQASPTWPTATLPRSGPIRHRSTLFACSAGTMDRCRSSSRARAGLWA